VGQIVYFNRVPTVEYDPYVYPYPYGYYYGPPFVWYGGVVVVHRRW
jgi:hypothetical protein